MLQPPNPPSLDGLKSLVSSLSIPIWVTRALGQLGLLSMMGFLEPCWINSLSLSLALSLSYQGDAGETGEPGLQGEVGPPVSYLITTLFLQRKTNILIPKKRSHCWLIAILQ